MAVCELFFPLVGASGSAFLAVDSIIRVNGSRADVGR